MANGALPGPAIEVKGLGKSFGRTQVLRNLNLEVRWGEVLVILGANGSGKTTLIKILSSLTRPDTGNVRVAGLDLSRLGQQVRRIIGVVTHEPLLYDGLTGYENLNFVGRLFGLDRLDERIAAVAALVGVTSRLHQKVGTLSHGLRKRFSLARAVLHDPPVLIMDEPDSGLDQEALALLDTIVTDPARPYRAVVMTTHSLERGLVLGHRTAILAGGGIAYEAAVDSSSGVDGLRRAYSRYTTTIP